MQPFHTINVSEMCGEVVLSQVAILLAFGPDEHNCRKGQPYNSCRERHEGYPYKTKSRNAGENQKALIGITIVILPIQIDSKSASSHLYETGNLF